MSNLALRVDGLSKCYRLGALQQANHRSLRESISTAAAKPFRMVQSMVRGTGMGRATAETLWSLLDVSFELERGQVLGVIGRNGAGKSTLLKVLARITDPTRGRIEVFGSLGSLLEVGTGFHPELTGRDNIFLAGAILGMGRADIVRQFDAIVDFAEIERFLDTPVKRYSSGMYMRLAFAVAAHFSPDILVMDEVLAVGDATFQQKCLNKMHTVAGEGRTVVFVSHNMSAIRALCDRVIVLQKGSVIEDTADMDQAIAKYADMEKRCQQWVRSPEDVLARPQLVFSKLELAVEGRQPDHVLRIQAELVSTGKHLPAFVAFNILDSSLTSIMQAVPNPQPFIECSTSPITLELEIELPPMIPGTYRITAWAGPHNTTTYDEAAAVLEFQIESSPDLRRTFPHASDHGFIVPKSIVSVGTDLCSA